MQPGSSAPNPLNEYQANRLLVSCTYIDKLLSDIEDVLSASSSKSPFPKYVSDITPVQRRVIEDYIARFRQRLVLILESSEIRVPAPRIGAAHSIKTTLAFVNISADELRPKYMRGYGQVPKAAEESLHGIVAELGSLVRQLDSYIGIGLGGDLASRLKVLEDLGQIGVTDLRVIEQIISDHSLVEFRPTLTGILNRLEDQSFEIAIFGRVSSGKSSLLNRILGTDLLPVGVTPITAVPTRIRVGREANLSVTFAGLKAESFDVSRISEFATEQQNPANTKRVEKLVLTLPSSRLKNGITFVDTPGLGSLAAAGASETLAYLPRCDFALVLIDAGSTLNHEDLDLLRQLWENGINCSVLISKADLVSEQQRVEIASYIERQISASLGVQMNTVPVSALPAYEDLLDTWYHQHLVPLFQDSTELRLQSVARKIGFLRASVQSSLESLQSRPTRTNQQVAEIEDSLRRFSGNFIQLGKEIDSILDEMAGSTDRIISQAARKVFDESQPGLELSLQAQAAIESIANAFGIRAYERMKLLIPQIVEQLNSSAQELSVPGTSTEVDFSSIVREMPRFECPAISQGSIKHRKSVGLLGNGIATNSFAKQIKKSIGKQLFEALSLYRTMLRTWSDNIVRRLQANFDSIADIYRGQMHRDASDSPNDGPLATVGKVTADLKRLREMATSGQSVRKEVEQV